MPDTGKNGKEVATPPLSHQLAMAVRAYATIAAEKTEVMSEFKTRMERIQQEITRLSNDILTGQGRLPLDSVVEAAVERIRDTATKDGCEVTIALEGGPSATIRPKKEKLDGKSAGAQN